MTREEMRAWFEAYGSIEMSYTQSWIPSDLNEFLDAVDKRHENLRKRLGGINKTIEISAKDVVRPANIHEVSKILSKVLAIVPDYYKDYNHAIRDTTFQYPNMAVGKIKKIATTKHIVGYGKRKKLAPAKMKELSDLATSLGELYQTEKSKKLNAYLSISTDPRAFALIGNYGSDTSCFSQGGINMDKKFAVARVPNSFVLLAHKGNLPEFEKGKTQGIIGRCFGYFNEEESTVSIFNMTGGYIDGGNAYSPQCLEIMAQSVFDVPDPKVATQVLIMNGGIGGGYGNKPYASTVYSASKFKDGIKETRLTIPTKYSRERYKESGRDGYADWNIKEPEYENQS